jgi:hypothetical protein
MLFVLRNDPAGWRIVGVIMQSSDVGARPLALDFEDEQQIHSFQTANSAPQNGSPSDAQPMSPETAAKPAVKAKDTTHQ